MREPGILSCSFEDITDEKLHRHFEAFGAWCDQNQRPVGIVVTAGELVRATAAQRKRFGDFEKRMAVHDRAYVYACALVVPNPVVRGLVTAVYWLSSPVYPYRLFTEATEATDWVRERQDEQLR